MGSFVMEYHRKDLKCIKIFLTYSIIGKINFYIRKLHNREEYKV